MSYLTPEAKSKLSATIRSLDLDDGVMVNSAALWPLLEPQWTKPKTWWSELCTAQGKKDYDWSHLAARYFPQRVAAKRRDKKQKKAGGVEDFEPLFNASAEAGDE